MKEENIPVNHWNYYKNELTYSYKVCMLYSRSYWRNIQNPILKTYKNISNISSSFKSRADFVSAPNLSDLPAFANNRKFGSGRMAKKSKYHVAPTGIMLQFEQGKHWLVPLAQ